MDSGKPPDKPILPCRGTLSRLVRAGAILLAAILILYFAAFVLMGTRWFHDAMERRIVHGIEASTGARVTLRSLSIEPLVFQATLRGLTLHGTESAASPPLFTAHTIVVRVNPVSAIRRRLFIERFEGTGITIHITTSKNGATNLPGPQQSSSASRLLNVSARNVILRETSLFWNNRRVRLDLAARHIALELRRTARGRYAGSFSSNPVKLVRPGLVAPPVSISTRFTFAQRSLSLSEITWSARGFQGRGAATAGWSHGIEGHAIFTSSGGAAFIARDLGWRAIRGGSVSVSGSAAFLHGDYSVHAQARATDLLIHEAGFAAGIDEIAAEIIARPRLIRLTGVRARAFGGSFTGLGEVRLSTGAPEFALRGNATGMSLAEALRSVAEGRRFERLLPLASSLSGDVSATWKGRLNNFQSSFQLSAAPPPRISVVGRPVVGHASGTLNLGLHPALTLDRAWFATPRSSLQTRGRLDAASSSSLSLRYSTTDFDETQRLIDSIFGLSKALPLSLQSQATFSGNVTGTISDPKFEGRVSSGRFTYRGWAWQSFSGKAVASPEGIAIEKGRLDSGPSIIDFSGAVTLADWKLTPGSQLRLIARADATPLGGLEGALAVHVPASGSASGSLALRGTPSNLAGSGQFRISRGEIIGEPFREFSGRMAISGSVIKFQNLVLHKGKGALSGWAQVNWPQRSFALQFRGAQLALADFKTLNRVAGVSSRDPTAPRIEGTLGVSVQASGTFADPQATAAVEIKGLTLSGKPAGDFRSDFLLKDKNLTGRGALNGTGGNLDFNLSASASAGWPATVTGEFSDLDLNPWIGLRSISLSAAPVVVSGSFHLKGLLSHPAQLAGSIEADHLAVLIPGFAVRNAGPVKLSLSDGSIRSNDFAMRGPSTDLKLHLSARLARPESISLVAQGDAQASLLKLVDPSLSAAGRFEIKLRAEGPPSLPSLSGVVRVENVSIRYAGLPIPLSELNGTILLNGNRATLKSFGEQSGQTSIGLTGYATLGSNPTVNLAAQFHHVRMEYPAGLISILSGRLRLAGSAASAQLAGDVTVEEMFAGTNFNVLDWIGQTGTSLAEPEAAMPSGPASRVRLEIRVATNPTVHLASRTLSYLAAINAKLGGTIARPVMTGDIHLREGQAMVAGTRYQIDRGDISMTNPVETSPVLEIQASTRVSHYRLTVDITGPADRPRISYRSDPPLPPEQILSLLALGYAPQQTMMTSSGAQHMGAIGAGSLLTQALSNQVSGRLQRLFGASRIRIDPNLLGPSTAGGARVTIEEQVSKNLSITYSTNTAAAQQRDIRLRWDLSNKISLIGERDINGVYGFEIRFRRSVR